MKITLEKAILLGIGMATAGKEQIEQTVGELVKIGELGRMEARSLADKLIYRKDEEEQRSETRITELTERIQTNLCQQNQAILEEIEQLKLRLLALEQNNDLHS